MNFYILTLFQIYPLLFFFIDVLSKVTLKNSGPSLFTEHSWYRCGLDLSSLREGSGVAGTHLLG